MATNIEEALSGGSLSVSAKPVTMEALPEATIDVGGGSQSLAIEGLGVKRKKDDLSVTTSSTSQIAIQDLFGDLLDEVNFSDPSSVDAFRSSAQTRIDEMDLDSVNRVLGTASSVASDISTLASPFLDRDSSQNQFQQVFGPPAPTSVTDSGGSGDVSTGSASGLGTEGIGSSRDFADLSALGDPSFAASAFGGAFGALGPGGSLGSFAAGQLGSIGSLSSAAQAFGGFQSLQNADISNPAGALAAVTSGLNAAKGVSGLLSQAKNIPDIFSDVEKTVSNFAQNVYNTITNPELAMEAYGRSMAYGTQFPDLYSFETKQGLATFAFDAKTGAIATPGLIAMMLPGPLKAAFNLTQGVAKELGYAQKMQSRNVSAIDAFTGPEYATNTPAVSLFSSPTAQIATDPTTGQPSSFTGSFASMDLGQQGFGQVSFDLGALADAMGPNGAVSDLSFTDYQDAAITGTLGHGPPGFDAFNEEEALAEDISYSFSEAGMTNAASMASNAAVSADLAAAAAAAYDQARGIDFSYNADEAGLVGELSAGRAFDAKDHAEINAAVNSMVQDLYSQYGRDFEMGLDRDTLTSLALEEEPLQAARAEIEQQKAVDFVASMEVAGQEAAMDYNSQAPNFDTVEAMQNLGFDYISMNALEMQAEKYALALEIAAIQTARGAKGAEGSEGFSGSARGSGGVDEAGYSDAVTTAAFDAFGAAFDTAAAGAAASAGDAGAGGGAPGPGKGGDVGAGEFGGGVAGDAGAGGGAAGVSGPDQGGDVGAGEFGGGIGGGDSDCFVQGTLVLMAEGSTKAIEKVVVGDLVAGKDGNANTVKATHIKKPDIPFLYGFNGHKPFVTAYHPFMTKEGWGCFEPEKFKEHRPTAYQEIANEQGGKDLIKIKNNCEILRSDNEWVLVEDIVVEGCDPNLTVYNLSVANDKTFVANNYIVHNKGESGKIICTAMNNMYGFGSYRNALWMKYQSSHMAAEEYELGYHKLVMPLVKKMPTNKTIRTVLERIAKRRTINIRKELRGQKLPLYYRSMKYTVRPLLFAVGWLVKKNLLSKTEI